MEEIRMNPAIWVPGLFSIAAALLSYFVSRRKTRAEASQITVKTAIELLDPLRAQIQESNEKILALTRRVDELEAGRKEDGEVIARLENGVAELTGQIEELGHEPRWPPELTTRT